MQNSFSCPAVMGSACSCLLGFTRQDQAVDVLNEMLFLAAGIYRHLKLKRSKPTMGLFFISILLGTELEIELNLRWEDYITSEFMAGINSEHSHYLYKSEPPF